MAFNRKGQDETSKTTRANLKNPISGEVLSISGKLRHGPQFASICSLRKLGGGLYLRALDVET